MNHLSGPIDFWTTDLFQSNKSADSVPGNECPCCGSIKIYALGDGRKKCGICGKKFSQTARKRRISKVLLRQVVEQFVAMVPAKQAAGVVGVNHKTALRVYRDIRRALVRKNQQLALRYMEECQSTTDIFACSPGEETLPLFAVAIQNQKIVLLPARYQGSWIKVHFPASVIYADRMTAMTLDFENFDQKNAWKPRGIMACKTLVFLALCQGAIQDLSRRNEGQLLAFFARNGLSIQFFPFWRSRGGHHR